MRSRAFTLVEIMIVVLIIGIILAIAMPQFIRAREGSHQKVCIANMRELEYAKEMFAGEMKLNSGDPCTLNDLWPNYMHGIAFPNCPGGGLYNVGVIGATPTCSLNAGAYPHTLGY